MVTLSSSRDIDCSEVCGFHQSLHANYGGEADHDCFFPVSVKFMKHDYLFTAIDAKQPTIHSSWPSLQVKGLGVMPRCPSYNDTSANEDNSFRNHIR